MWLGDGRGEFAGPFNYAAGSFGHDLVARDIDGDGVTDLLAGGYTAGFSEGETLVSTLGLLRGSGCDAPAAYSVGYVRYLEPRSTHVAAADLNGDQRLDLITGGFEGAAVFLAVGNGDFGSRSVLPESANATAVAVGNLDSDDKPDIVAANPLSDSVLMYANNGDGNFVLRDRVAVGDRPNALVVADLNADGRTDVVVAHPDGLVVLLASSDGQYENAGAIVAEIGERQGSFGSRPLLADDFDRNGTLDLAVSLTAGIGILPGSGDGHFAEMRTIPGIASPANGLVAGDFDGDGIKDLASTNAGSSSVTLLHGQGDGTFVIANRVAASHDPQGIDVQDLNRDGHLDLVTSEVRGEEIVVLLGRGDGTFVARRFAGVSPSHFLLLRDFDGDDDFDVLTVNGIAMSIQPGMSLPCALTHDATSHLPGIICTLSTSDGAGQTLKCGF